MIGCVALTPTLLHSALPGCCCGGSCSLALSHTLTVSCSHTRRTLYIFRLRSDTCSDPRKCDFEPGISWRRLKNKTLLLLLLPLLLPPLLPLPLSLLLLQLHLQLLLLALAPGPVECGKLVWVGLFATTTTLMRPPPLRLALGEGAGVLGRHKS